MVTDNFLFLFLMQCNPADSRFTGIFENYEEGCSADNILLLRTAE